MWCTSRFGQRRHQARQIGETGLRGGRYASGRRQWVGCGGKSALKIPMPHHHDRLWQYCNSRGSGEARAVDYLAKPADADEIHAALVAVMGRASPPENPMSADRVRGS